MKKLSRFLLPILLLNSVLLSGCENDKKDSKIILSYGDMNTTDVVEISYTQLQGMFAKDDDGKLLTDKRQNFIVAVESKGCACWSKFYGFLKPYLVENHLICYKLTNKDFEDVPDKFGIDVSNGSSFAIFENGVNRYSLTSGSKVLNDKAAFEDFMEKTVKMPKCYYVNKTQINTFFESLYKGVIYFGRSACPDCTYVNGGIIYDYVKNHYDNMENLYMLDMQSDYRKSGEEGYDEYIALKNDYLLSADANTKYGYLGGVFPSFMLFDKGEAVSGAVCYNDTISKEGDDYVVTESYYTNERKADLQYLDNFKGTSVLKGMKLTEGVEDYGSYGYGWAHDAATKYYAPLLTAFLDYALPQTNWKF